MHIVVCIKQIIDPEIPPHVFQIDPVAKKQIRGRQVLVISTFDEVALEVALQMKEKEDGTVTALTIGESQAVEALHAALAMGADEAVLVSDPAFENTDSFGTAHILAAALQKVGEFDAVLCGRQAGDVEMGLVGPFLAEKVGLPCVTLAANMEAGDGTTRLRRPIEGGYEVLETATPFLATIMNDDSNIPRYVSVRGLRKAMRSEVPVWSAADLGLDPAKLGSETAKIELEELFVPKREIRCEFIEGETGSETGKQLALRLRELKLI